MFFFPRLGLVVALRAGFFFEGFAFFELEGIDLTTTRSPLVGAGLTKKIGNALNPHGGHSDRQTCE
jgi:hypothetical protein